VSPVVVGVAAYALAIASDMRKDLKIYIIADLKDEGDNNARGKAKQNRC